QYVLRAYDLCQRGNEAAARAELAKLAEDSPVFTPQSPGVRFVAELAFLLGDAALARKVRPAVRRFENRMVSWGRIGMFVEGATSWLLAMGLAATGEHAEAERCFEQALKLCNEVGMRPYEVVTCIAYARMLSARGPEHAPKIRALAERGLAIADAIGVPAQ